jgi:hypothetical protein
VEPVDVTVVDRRGHGLVVHASVKPPSAFRDSAGTDRDRRVSYPQVVPRFLLALSLAIVLPAFASRGESVLVARSAEPPRAPKARLHVRVTDTTGRGIEARLRLEGRWLTATPALGPVHDAAGAGDTVLVPPDGRAIELERGSYRAIASRGPEWSLATREIDIDAARAHELVLVLRRERSIAGYVPCDLHLHSEGSPDSRVSFDDRLLSIAAEGIEVAVISEHNRVVDLRERASARGLTTLVGVEVTTWEPAFGHFNVYPVPHHPSRADGGAPRHLGTSPADLFRAAHALGDDTLVQVNHPRLDDAIGYFDAYPPDDPERAVFGFDAIEVWNGYEIDRPVDADRNFHEWLGLLARGLRVTATASSDSHDLSEHIAGYPRTYARASDSSEVSIAAAIRRGAAFVTSGPLLDVSIGDRGPGDEVDADGVVRVAIAVDAPEYARELDLEVYLGRARVYDEELAMDRGRARREIDLEVHEAAPLVVRVTGPLSTTERLPQPIYPAAFSNPIWLVP